MYQILLSNFDDAFDSHKDKVDGKIEIEIRVRVPKSVWDDKNVTIMLTKKRNSTVTP